MKVIYEKIQKIALNKKTTKSIYEYLESIVNDSNLIGNYPEIKEFLNKYIAEKDLIIQTNKEINEENGIDEYSLFSGVLEGTLQGEVK